MTKMRSRVPATNAWAASTNNTVRHGRDRLTSARPARIDWRPSSGSTTIGSEPSRPSVAAAPRNTSPAKTMNGAAKPLTPNSTAAIAGPTSVEAPSIHPSVTLVAASVRGLSTRLGSIAATLGRVVVTEIAATTAAA